jgi:hypothetical protein
LGECGEFDPSWEKPEEATAERGRKESSRKEEENATSGQQQQCQLFEKWPHGNLQIVLQSNKLIWLVQMEV